MANKHLKLDSHHKDDNWWYYERPGGIDIVHQATDRNGNALTPETMRITWVKLRNMLKRKDE